MTLISRNDVDGNSTGFMGSVTAESIEQFQPCRLFEDFTGPGHVVPAAGSASVGYAWVAKIVDTAGTPTVAVTSNGAGGIMACALDSTSEAQEATIYANDVLNWDVTKGLVWEARVALSVIPTGVAAASWGINSAWTANGATSFYLNFAVAASGAVNLRSKDGVNTVSTATGVTLTAGSYHVFRIDARDVTKVVYQIDGATVGTSAFAATGASAILQPYAGVWKASGAGLGTLAIDRVMVAMNRS